MRLRVLTYKEIDRQQWDTLVRESATGTWFQTPEAYDFFASLPEVMEPFVYAVFRYQEMKAVCVGYITKERNPIKQFFTRRAIINGGVCIAENAEKAEIVRLLNTVRVALLRKTIYVETRNFHDYSAWKEVFEKTGFAYQKHLNFHIDCSDKEAMWKHLSETRRRQVRKGSAMNDVGLAISEDDVRAYYKILSDLYRRKVKTPLWSEEVFVAFYRQKKGVYLLVKQAGKVIGGIMCPVWEGKCIYEWFVCGLDAEYKEQYPSVMATWAAMQYANEHDIPLFDIMGAGVPDVPYGVRDFKAEFGGTLVEHGRFLRINKPLLYKIGAWGVKMLKNR